MVQGKRALFLSLTFTLALTGGMTPAHAWLKQGHASVCRVAAYLSARQPGAGFLKDHAYDLSYYCNVPDLVWKRPAHYQDEWYNHFMNLEVFEREIKDLKPQKHFAMSRADFDAAHPNIPESAGRSFWRVQEILKRVEKITAELKRTDLTREQRQSLQTDWLVNAGILGHYIGDLAQPLHVSENSDGQLTGQKLLHLWFEDDAVNEAFFGKDGSLEADVMRTAEAKWKKIGADWQKKTILDLLIDLGNDSRSNLEAVLAADNKAGRGDLKKSAGIFRPLFVERLAAGAVALAAIWNRELGWEFDKTNFLLTFIPEPTYIAPEKGPAPASAPDSAKK